MTILDRYIARQYLFNVFALLLILFSFVLVIDVSLNMDRFLRLADKLAATDAQEAPSTIRRWIVTSLLIADLWWPKLLQLYNFLIGMVLVGAMGFTFSQMTKHREFVAMMAAGVGLHRVVRPVIIIAIGFTAFQLVNMELIIPKIAPLLVRDHGDAGTRNLGSASVPLTLDGSGKLFRAASFDADADTLTGVYILERDEQGKATRVITADSAAYRDGGWDLRGGLAQNRGSAIIEPKTPINRIESSLDPNELRMNRYESYSQSMSFMQVSQMLNRESLTDPIKRARYTRIKWGRFAVMISSLLALVIAMPFYITREPKNMVIQSIKCAPVAIISLIGGVLGASASIPGVPPALAVFIPVMLLSVIAVAQVSSMKT
ncbi:MAG: LptF/LptG family permease [Phycisphaerales bacterium]|nr:LptF/LptG family permease [Phycisphaerales bacterium]